MDRVRQSGNARGLIQPRSTSFATPSTRIKTLRQSNCLCASLQFIEQCRKHCTLLDIVCAFRGTLHLQIFYKYVIHVRENPQFSDKAIFNIIYESSWSLREDGDIKIGEPCQSTRFGFIEKTISRGEHEVFSEVLTDPHFSFFNLTSITLSYIISFLSFCLLSFHHRKRTSVSPCV